MTSLLTTTQVSERLNVTVRRVQAMLHQRCPSCILESAPGCVRCKGSGHKLPHVNGGRSGTGTIKLVYAWALELPDVKNSTVGRPSGIPGVTVVKDGKGYSVFAGEEKAGAVYRVSDARRSWSNGGEGLFRSRKAAILALSEE